MGFESRKTFAANFVNESLDNLLALVVGKWSLVALAVVGVDRLKLGEVFPALQIDHNTLQQQLVIGKASSTCMSLCSCMLYLYREKTSHCKTTQTLINLLYLNDSKKFLAFAE